MTSHPRITSTISTLLLMIIGSNREVKKPIVDKQVTETETLEYLILPQKNNQCKETIAPTPKNCQVDFHEILLNSLLKYIRITRIRALKNIRYKVSNPSFNSISFPKIAVKPARISAKCSWRKAFFTEYYKILEIKIRIFSTEIKKSKLEPDGALI